MLLIVLPAHADESLDELRPFLKQYCYECHGEEKQKNDLRFDTLPANLADPAVLTTWQDILDQLNLGEMPPPKAKAHPLKDEAQAAVETLSPILKQAYAERKSTGRETVMRRLNRIELRNTLRDLLYLDGAEWRELGMPKLVDNNGNGITSRESTDPVRDFPADEIEEGFDTIGARLVMSDFLLKLLIGAAEESLAMATKVEEKPKVETRRYAGHIRTQGPPGLQRWSREVNPDYDAIFQRYREPGASSGGLGRITADELARQGVGVAGRYRIIIEASSHNQVHPWGALIKSRQEEPMLLGLHMCDARRGGFNDSNPTSRQLTQWPMTADGKKREYVYETYLDATWTPWIGWENAPYDRGLRIPTLVETYLPGVFKPMPDKKASNEAKNAYESEMARALFEAGYQGPHLRVHSLTLEPLMETWPPRSHTHLYGENAESKISDLILSFARRAFRSPVEAEEVARYVELVQTQLLAGVDRKEALRAGYTAILASPRFYYLQEGGSPGRLDDYQLASRLSYFLWSSMPDEELFGLAAASKLADPAVLSAQVERMLGHRNAAAFFRRFPERWLRLDKLGAMPPERGGPFRIYWDRQMEPQMVKQTEAFFADLVRTNGNIRNFIHSDYTFLNERVATILYGRDDVWGDAFRKVPVVDPRRGGILTQPSVMTATANGVDTSPVVRGVWVLENILGSPPSPPPPDVEPLAPDLRGAQTIREQLERHRKVASCNNCHRKIDPMGFALENFNPVGMWRTTYPDTRKPIDPSATLSNGREVSDIVALKQYLLERQDDVTRCLTGKLLAYASGRVLEPGDRGEVDAIVESVTAKGNGLRDLIQLIVQSEVFLTK